jgi:hypothetical protein
MKNATKNVNQDIKLIKSNSHSIQNYLPRSYKIELNIIGFLIFIIVFIFISTKIWEFYLESPFCLKKHKKKDKKSKLVKDIAMQFQKGQYFKKYFKEIFNRSFAELIVLAIGAIVGSFIVVAGVAMLTTEFFEAVKDFKMTTIEFLDFSAKAIGVLTILSNLVKSIQNLTAKARNDKSTEE